MLRNFKLATESLLVENISFADALDSVGRSSLGGYHASDYTISDTKANERRRVAEFILRNSIGDFIWLLSMPGADWYFERLIQSMTEKPVQIVGIEENYAVYAQACRSMPEGRSKSAPRKEMQSQQRELHLGSARYNYCRTGFMRNRKGEGRRDIRSHRLLLMPAETYTAMAVYGFGATMEQRMQFADKFMYRTAAWLDFTSPICKSTLDAISNLHFCMKADGSQKPVVITVMACRDSYLSMESRVAAITSAQPALNVVDAWKYTGKGGVSMLTVCGMIV